MKIILFILLIQCGLYSQVNNDETFYVDRLLRQDYSTDSLKQLIQVNLDTLDSRIIYIKTQYLKLLHENLKLNHSFDSLSAWVDQYKSATNYFFDTVLVRTQHAIDSLFLNNPLVHPRR